MHPSPQAASGRLHVGLPAVQLHQVSVRFGSFTAVQGVDLSIGEGEFVAVVGPTGCGKSTLLNAVTGLLKPAGGTVSVFGEPLTGLNGDAGFMMNSQEIETALRLGLALVVLIWRDDKYGLIEWHQNIKFGRPSHIDFGNPDLVKFAESFGARGYRVEAARDLVPTLQQALTCGTVAIIDCPVDYSENMKLTEKLGKLSVRI